MLLAKVHCHFATRSSVKPEAMANGLLKCSVPGAPYFSQCIWKNPLGFIQCNFAFLVKTKTKNYKYGMFLTILNSCRI